MPRGFLKLLDNQMQLPLRIAFHSTANSTLIYRSSLSLFCAMDHRLRMYLTCHVRTLSFYEPFTLHLPINAWPRSRLNSYYYWFWWLCSHLKPSQFGPFYVRTQHFSQSSLDWSAFHGWKRSEQWYIKLFNTIHPPSPLLELQCIWHISYAGISCTTSASFLTELAAQEIASMKRLLFLKKFTRQIITLKK